MYLYQPALLSLVLYDWAFDRSGRRSRWFRSLFFLLVLIVSPRELDFERVWLYPAALLLPFAWILHRVRIVAWAEVFTASLLGGLVGWKAADLWPLFSGIELLCSALLLIPVMLLCRNKEDRCLSCALGGLFFELFFCLREYILFSFCVIRVGSRASLSLSTAALCLSAVLEQRHGRILPRRKRAISIGN